MIDNRFYGLDQSEFASKIGTLGGTQTATRHDGRRGEELVQ